MHEATKHLRTLASRIGDGALERVPLRRLCSPDQPVAAVPGG